MKSHNENELIERHARYVANTLTDHIRTYLRFKPRFSDASTASYPLVKVGSSKNAFTESLQADTFKENLYTKGFVLIPD